MCIYQADESNFLTKIYERKNLMDYMLFYEQLFCKQYQDEIAKKKKQKLSNNLRLKLWQDENRSCKTTSLSVSMTLHDLLYGQ